MSSTVTVSEVFQRIFGPELDQALAEIDLGCNVNTGSINVNDAADKYLEPAINQALSRVSVKEERFCLHVETDELVISLNAKGKWLLITTSLLCLTTALLVTDKETVLALLKIIERLV